MRRSKTLSYAQLLAGILIVTAFLTPRVELTVAQRAASVIPASIRAYELIELDGAALRADVEAGQPITLSFGARQFDVQLVPNNLLAPEYAAQLEPAQRNTGTFRGIVVGDPESSVRLSLREGIVRGYVLTGAGDWYFIEPIRNYADPATLGVSENLHFTYKTTDVIFQADLSHDVLPLNSDLLAEEQAQIDPEELTSPSAEQWVEYQRTQSAILYYDEAHPWVKQGEFGHTFTWDVNTGTWASYVLTQETEDEYQVRVSSGSYVVNAQGAQLVDPIQGTELIRAANWQVMRWDSSTGVWLPVEFSNVTVIATRTTDVLQVNRTCNGGFTTGQLTETYQFEEGMKVTATYTAGEEGTYRLEWGIQGLPLTPAPADGTISMVELSRPHLQFDRVGVSWIDAEEQLERAKISSTAKEKTLILQFEAVPLEVGDNLEIDPWVGFKTWGGNGDGWINKDTSTWIYDGNNLHIANRPNNYNGHYETHISFDLQGLLDHASEILQERVKLYEHTNIGSFTQGNEVIQMGYFQDNVQMGYGGDQLLDTWQEISNANNREPGLVANHSDINGNWLDLDTNNQWVYWYVPVAQLGNWTQPGDQYANYYLWDVNFDANSDWVKFYAREYSGTTYDPKLYLKWKEAKEVLHLEFESLSNNVVVDSSEYGHNGTATNSPVLAAGILGDYGLDLDGSNDYVDLDDPLALRLDDSDFTIAAWVNLDTDSKSSTIFFESGASGGAESYQMINFLIKKTTRQLKLAFYGDVKTSSAVVPKNQWTHVAVTYNQTSKVGKFYINGIQQGPDYTFNHGPSFWEWTGAQIGRSYYNELATAYFDGTLDELHVYTQVLSQPEVDTLYRITTYSGYVLDYAGEPIDGAKVERVGTSDYATTNASGYYMFATPPGTGEYTLKASKTYFRSVQTQVSPVGGSHTVNFTLPWIAKVYYVVDDAFTDIFDNYSPDWMSAAEDLMNEVEGVYYDQLGVNFSVGIYECTTCTSANGTILMDDQLIPYLNSSYERDFVFLSTGSDIYLTNQTTGDPIYGVLGFARPYTLAQWNEANAVGEYAGHTDFIRCIIAAHEIGHLFGGTHEPADTPGGQAARWQEGGEWYTSIMYSGISDEMVALFTDGSSEFYGRDNKTPMLNIAKDELPD